MQGPAQISMQLDCEVQRLQHEVEVLRLKDLQQDHHIHILTQQLRGSHPDPHQADTQEQAEPPALPSSVTAKWQEWRQHRSLSPKHFRSQAFRPLPGDMSKAPLRQGRSVIKEALHALPSCSLQPAGSPAAQGTHLARHSGSKPTHTHHEAARVQAAPQESHYQISAAVGASGRAGRSKGTFGSEHRWYQPTQAAGQAAALTHAALAAAAAEQQLNGSHWLLKSATDGQSRSARRCTFGGELRWWESAEPGRGPHTAEAGPRHHHHQAVLAPAGFAHNARESSDKLEEPPAVQAGSPDQDSRLHGRSSHEVQWWGNAATGQRLMQSASAAAEASASQAGPAHGTDHRRQPSLPADRCLRQAQPLVSAEQAWWKSDRNPSPDSTLMRIQQKHARIQSLAAIIKQRPTSARTHTAKSTFGSEARWWEKSSAHEEASASGHSPDQQQAGSSRTPSPDRSHRMQLMSPDTRACDAHGVSKGRSTFGSEARWWEPSRLAAPTAVAVQDKAVEQTSLPADRALPNREAGDSWWGRSQECHALLPPHAPLPNAALHFSSMLIEAQSSPQVQAGQPANSSVNTQQQSSQRLPAQPWAAGSQLPTQAGSQPDCTGQLGVTSAPNRTPVRGSRCSSTPRATSTRQSRCSITPVATPMRQSRGSISPSSVSRRSSVSVRHSRDWGRERKGRSSSVIERSRSASPDGCGKGGRQLNRIPSSRPELQDELRHRSAERQRLEQVVAPHPTNWAQGLREGTHTFQRRNSRAEARALQLDFLQKAREELETFQHNCAAAAAAAHGLPASDRPGSSSRHSNEAAPALDEQEVVRQSHSRHADSDATAANDAANRCARKWLRAAKQGQYAQASGQGKVQQTPALGPGLSHQSSASKAAMQVQQQQLAAQEAEQRLMAFCQATEGSNAEGSNAEVTRQHQHEAEPTSKAASAAPVMGGYSAQQMIQQPKRAKQQAAFSLSMTAPKKLMTHSSLPSTYAAPSAPQGGAGSKIVRSVSWAQQLELQEPPHDDSYDLPHNCAHMSHGLPPTVPGTAAIRPTLCAADNGDSTVRSTSAVNVDSNQSRREALTEYYKAKQAAATLLSQQAAASAAPALVTDAVPHAGSSAPPSAAPLNSHVASASSLVSHSSSASVNCSAAEDIVGPPARRMSLLLAQARFQARADALSPGKPGLKSQLSQMMEEVAQARSEVQEVQSQLSVHSRLGLRGGSVASSLMSNDSKTAVDAA